MTKTMIQNCHNSRYILGVPRLLLLLVSFFCCLPTLCLGTSSRINDVGHRYNGTLMQSNNYRPYPIHSVQISLSSTNYDEEQLKSIKPFRILLLPLQYPSLCGNNTLTSITNQNDSFYRRLFGSESSVQGEVKNPIGIIIRTDDNCTMKERISTVEYINHYLLSSSFHIQYIILENEVGLDSNNTNNSDNSWNMSTSDVIILYGSNDTIVAITNTIYDTMNRSETLSSPYLFDEGNDNWTLTFILKINDSQLLNDPFYHTYGSLHSAISTGAVGFALINFMFILCIFGCLVNSMIKQRRAVVHPTTDTENEPAQAIYSRKEHRLTQTEFDALSEVQYEKGLYQKMKMERMKMEQSLSNPFDTEKGVLRVLPGKNDYVDNCVSVGAVIGENLVNNTFDDSLSRNRSVEASCTTSTTVQTLASTVSEVEERNERSIFLGMMTMSMDWSSRRLQGMNDAVACHGALDERVMPIATTTTSTNSSSSITTTDNNINNRDLESQQVADEEGFNSKHSSQGIAFADTGEMCPICIDDFTPGENVIALPRCHHIYHKECVRQWLLRKEGQCPLCKMYVLNDEQLFQRTKIDHISLSSNSC